MTRGDFIVALRDTADFYEERTALPTPSGLFFSMFASRELEKAKAEVAAFLSGGSQVTKKDFDDYIELCLALPTGGKISLYVRKETLGCRKVKVERIIMEEKWQCGPILDAIAEAES